MKTWLIVVLALGGGSLASAAVAEESFTRTISAEDFAAAGLAKLSASELARLDALVGAFRRATGAPAPAPVERPRAAAAAAPRAKVQVAPGTEIEVAAVESRLVGEFRGWEDRVVFTLGNGQRWRVAPGQSYFGSPQMNPAVKIAPGMLGTFWMSIEGVKVRVRVVPVDSGN